MNTAPCDRRQAEAKLEATAPGYLQRARTGARLLAVRRDDDGLEAVLADVAAVAHFDAAAPPASPDRRVRALKRRVRDLTSWYVGYLTDGLDGVAGGVEHLATALVARVDEAEERRGRHDAELAAMRARIERLEAADTARREGRR